MMIGFIDGLCKYFFQIICDPTPWASDQNIVDGYYRAADESCGWLTNSQPSTPAKIKIIFEQEVRIALIRIWNYRASSDETWRGVRFLVVKVRKFVFMLTIS